MKLLLVSALLFVLSTLPADGSAVYATSGNILKPGTPYYITSTIWWRTLPPFSSKICTKCRWCCPLNVAQKSSDLDRGLPVCLSPPTRAQMSRSPSVFVPTNSSAEVERPRQRSPSVFVPTNSSKEDVHLPTDLKIEFTSPSSDGGSPIWKLDSTDFNGQRYVTLNENPYNTIDVKNWFKIDKTGAFGYKLLYCPDKSGNLALSDM